MRFTKWQGLGNDFLVVEETNLHAPITPELAQAICDRHFGVGADGILVLGTRPNGEFTMVIHNADGSQAEMCGNGIRVVARHLVDAGHASAGDDIIIDTAGGTMRPQVLSDGRVRVDMGTLRTTGHATVDVDIIGRWDGRAVDAGNPHFVVRHDPDTIDLHTIGRAIEHHHHFPNRTNVEFYNVLDPATVRMRVWERGVGETLACGTGACAVAVTAILDDHAQSPVTVWLPGGPLEIAVTEDLHVHMTGAATMVYEGTIDTTAVLEAWHSYQTTTPTQETALS